MVENTTKTPCLLQTICKTMFGVNSLLFLLRWGASIHKNASYCPTDILKKNWPWYGLNSSVGRWTSPHYPDFGAGSVPKNLLSFFMESMKRIRSEEWIHFFPIIRESCQNFFSQFCKFCKIVFPFFCHKLMSQRVWGVLIQTLCIFESFSRYATHLPLSSYLKQSEVLSLPDFVSFIRF